jgi:hypothetical protein
MGFILTMERVSECVKIYRILFVGIHTLWGGGRQYFGISSRFDFKRGRVVVIFTYINLYIYVWWLFHIGFMSRKGGGFHSSLEEGTRHILWPLACKGPSHARRGHITPTNTMRGTYWHVAAHDFGGWQSRVLSHKMHFRKKNQLCFPQSHPFLRPLCTRFGGLLLRLITLNHTHTHTPLGERSVRLRDLCLTTYNTRQRQTSVLPTGFEPTVPSREWSQTHPLDRSATGIGI